MKISSFLIALYFSVSLLLLFGGMWGSLVNVSIRYSAMVSAWSSIVVVQFPSGFCIEGIWVSGPLSYFVLFHKE